MGAAWLGAAEAVPREATAVTLPVTETVYFDPRDPAALGYWFPMTAGRRVTVTIDSDHDYFFADVFRIRATDGAEAAVELIEPVASRGSEGSEIVFEPHRNAYYLLRLQPELLRGGRFTVSIGERAALTFPVDGADAGDIWSFFGDRRDGGARDHHGIDIFAPRGTAVHAVTHADVLRVGQRERGGNVVVLRDSERDLLLYYAHLDEHRTTAGTSVAPGDIIGTVGNTGNAVTTPPHLHFGVYQGGWRRPIDPWPYVVSPAEGTAPPVPDATGVGGWGVVHRDVTGTNRIPERRVETPKNRNPNLRGAGDSFHGAAIAPVTPERTPAIAEVTIDAGAPIRIVGRSSDSVRVRTVNGLTVQLPPVAVAVTGPRASVPEGDLRPLSDDRLARDVISGDAIGVLSAGDEVALIADLGGGSLARTASGRTLVLTSP